MSRIFVKRRNSWIRLDPTLRTQTLVVLALVLAAVGIVTMFVSALVGK